VVEMKQLNQITVTEIDDICTVYSARGRNAEMKNRPNYGISFCKNGKIPYNHNGHITVSDSRHVILLPMGQSYRLHANETGDFALINFRCKEYICDHFISLPCDNCDELFALFEKAKKLALLKENHARVMSILYDLLQHIAADNQKEKNNLFGCKEYIRKHFQDETLNNRMIADQIGLSEVWFRRCFYRNYGITPKQYILDLRIQYAKQLLETEHCSVTDISKSCGFSSVYYFCRAFKNKTGMAPTEYANLNKIYQI